MTPPPKLSLAGGKDEVLTPREKVSAHVAQLNARHGPSWLEEPDGPLAIPDFHMPVLSRGWVIVLWVCGVYLLVLGVWVAFG